MQNNCSNGESFENKEVVYAGFWVRLAAYLIDSIIVFAGLLIVRLVLSGMSLLLDGTFLGGNILFHYTLKDIILYIAEVLYFILLTYYTGTTLGKKALNLCVVSAKEEKLTLLNVVYRETIGRFLSGLIIGIGYILIGLDKEKRGLHDILCDTRVVYTKKVKIYPVYQVPKANIVTYDSNSGQKYQYKMVAPKQEGATVPPRQEQVVKSQDMMPSCEEEQQ